MPPEISADLATCTLPGLSVAAQRAGRALVNLTEAELLSVLGAELQRRGLQHLGALPKPRAKASRRKLIEREQMLLALPVHDDMCDR
ncbi:hypothetical protein GCM10028796_31460 [Ramlibacter monticola]